jgi:hypothetical protein
MANENDQKLAYIEGLKTWAEEDKKVVFLWIAFDLAAVVFLLSDKVAQEFTNSPDTAIGLSCLAMNALLYFRYYHSLHRTILNVNSKLLDLNVDGAKKMVDAAWQRNASWFTAGSVFLVAGIALLVVQHLCQVKWNLR